MPNHINMYSKKKRKSSRRKRRRTRRKKRKSSRRKRRRTRRKRRKNSRRKRRRTRRKRGGDCENVLLDVDGKIIDIKGYEGKEVITWLKKNKKGIYSPTQERIKHNACKHMYGILSKCKGKCDGEETKLVKCKGMLYNTTKPTSWCTIGHSESDIVQAKYKRDKAEGKRRAQQAPAEEEGKEANKKEDAELIKPIVVARRKVEL